jgi:hypothetical protein
MIVGRRMGIFLTLRLGRGGKPEESVARMLFMRT